jgi:hypothetical protein
MPSSGEKNRMGLFFANMLTGSYTWLYSPLPSTLSPEFGSHILFSKYCGSQKGAILLVDDPTIYTKTASTKAFSQLQDQGFKPIIPLFYKDQKGFFKEGTFDQSRLLTLSPTEDHFSINNELYYYQPPAGSLEEAIHLVKLEKVGIKKSKNIHIITSEEIIKYPFTIDIQEDRLIKSRFINPEYQQLTPFS